MLDPIWVGLLSFIMHLSFYITVNSLSSCNSLLNVGLNDHLRIFFCWSQLLLQYFPSDFLPNVP